MGLSVWVFLWTLWNRLGMSETICGIISGCLEFSLGLLGTDCEGLVLSGAVLDSLDSFGLNGAFSGSVWGSLRLSWILCGTLWDCLGMSGNVLDCLGLSGTVKDFLWVNLG